MKPSECPQPFCALQQDGIDREKVAEMLVRLLAGERVSPLRPSPPEETRGTCVACALRIMDGKEPLTWGLEHEDLVSGWKHYRRERRRRMRKRTGTLNAR